MDQKVASYTGCLLGMAVGDAMGYTVDKKTWDEICADYGPNGLLGYDLVNGGADVTSCTAFMACACRVGNSCGIVVAMLLVGSALPMVTSGSRADSANKASSAMRLNRWNVSRLSSRR